MGLHDEFPGIWSVLSLHRRCACCRVVYSCPAVSRRPCFFVTIHCLWLYPSFHLFSHNDSWGLGGGVQYTCSIQSLAFQSLTLWILASCGSLSQSPTIAIRIFWWGLSYEPIYGYNIKLLGVCLILYLFSRIIEQGSPLLAYGLCSHRFLTPILVPGMDFVFWGRISIQCERDWLLPCHSCCYITPVFVVRPVIVAHRVYSRRVLMITFLLPGLWMLANRDEVSRWAPAWFLHVLWLLYAVSSNVGSYWQVLNGTKSVVNSL